MCGSSKAAGTYVVPGLHFVQFRFRAGLCLDPWQRTANLNSSAISEHNDCLSVWAFFLLFQQNSNIATSIANARPHSNTTNTPPTSRKFENIIKPFGKGFLYFFTELNVLNDVGTRK